MDDFEFSPLKNFDKSLQKFYYDVIGKEVNLNIMWKAHSIRRALSEVVKAYKKRPRRKSDIRFDSPYRRCAYLLKHSPCFTSAVAKYFHTLVNQHKGLIENAFKSGNLEICCLGGGPATDAVALVHVIRYLYQPYWMESRQILRLNINVVDISEEWRETAKNVLECLKRTPEFFGNGEISLTYTFLSADLTEKMDKQLQMVLRSADIITMIYFLSAVTGTRGRKTCEDMVDNIMLQMKKEAFVFFLDSAVDKHYEILNKASEKRNVMRQIYGPLVEEFHTISIESVQSFINLYGNHFHRLICMTYMFFCVSSWQKPTIKPAKKMIRREFLNEPPPSWKKPTEEESDDLTRKMKQYRSAVYRLLNRRFDPTYNTKSYNNIGNDMPGSRNFRKNDFEQQKVDINMKDFAGSRDFRKIDFELRKSCTTKSSNVESCRNFEKIDARIQTPHSTQNADFENRKSFERNRFRTPKVDSDSTYESISEMRQKHGQYRADNKTAYERRAGIQSLRTVVVNSG